MLILIAAVARGRGPRELRQIALATAAAMGGLPGRGRVSTRASSFAPMIFPVCSGP